jgi:molybdate transport repressor ModE-like protein
MNIKLSFSWSVNEADFNYEIDPLLFELLTLIKQYGSLKQAAELSKVSYRHAWGMLNNWHHRFGQTLVVLEKGRGATLSPLGEHLLNGNMQLTARYLTELENFSTQFKREFQSICHRSEKDSLNIFASHGLAIGALRDIINQQTNFKLDLHFHGSLESLNSLTKGECDIASFHIPIGPVSKPLQPQYLAILEQNKYQLVYVVKRNQGLIFKPENNNKITGIESLAENNIRFINRQSGSGTRLLFDHLLKEHGIKTEQIQGYEQEEFTHLAVAALVASGAADVGFGIAPIAEQFSLGFLPIVWEHYCLAIPKQLVQDERVKQIIRFLDSDDYRQRLGASSGYQCEQSGKLVSFESIFD